MRIFLFFSALFINGAVQAQTILTEETIDAFYQSMQDVQFKNRKPEELEVFFNRHISDDLTYSLILKKEVMDEKRPDETLILTKGDLLKRTMPIHKAGANRFNFSVLEANISPDGRDAKTKVQRRAEFIMDTKGQFGVPEVLMVQTQTCEDRLSLSAKDFIQLDVSVCQGDVTITKPQVSKTP